MSHHHRVRIFYQNRSNAVNRPHSWSYCRIAIARCSVGSDLRFAIHRMRVGVSPKTRNAPGVGPYCCNAAMAARKSRHGSRSFTAIAKAVCTLFQSVAAEQAARLQIRSKNAMTTWACVVRDGAGKPLVMPLSEGQMSDHKGARFTLDVLPPASALIADEQPPRMGQWPQTESDALH